MEEDAAMLELPSSLNLHVSGHLSAEDAERQRRTAAAILQRFEVQPGVILGDEVGMGKTFVALAVAAAHAVNDPSRPVVVMVPSGVLRKWVRDADTFREACLRGAAERGRFRVRYAESGVQFLKLLDDSVNFRASLILLSHGALHRKLADSWVKLAVLQASIKGRHGVESLRQRLARFGPMLLRHASVPDMYYDLFMNLLKNDTATWKDILVRAEWLEKNADDPVPMKFVDVLAGIDLGDVFNSVIEKLPQRASENIRDRIMEARKSLDNTRDGVIPRVWKETLARMKLDLPLLVLDEAHRVKNAHTQLASLLAEEREDLDTAAGQFAQAFDRMLFLTATPFQLGHGELHNVLSRFTAVRWTGSRAPRMGRDNFVDAIQAMHADLDAMQLATDRLERAWKRLLAVDVQEAQRALGVEWWIGPEGAANIVAGTVINDALLNISNERVRTVVLAFRAAQEAICKGELALQPWVLRHARPLRLPPPNEAVSRRQRVEGAAVRAEIDGGVAVADGGLRIGGEGSLTFFLAARLSTLPDSPVVFAEGIASSFEALLNTRKDGELVQPASQPEVLVAPRGQWYVDRLQASARMLESLGYHSHPKLATTVDLAMALWRRGEKVLIFNQYRETGSALHRALSEVMLDEIERMGGARFGCPAAEVQDRIVSMSRRWDKGEPSALAAVSLLDGMLDQYPGLFAMDVRQSVDAVFDGEIFREVDVMDEGAVRDAIHNIVLRFLRTPTFFLRYAPKDGDLDPKEYVRRCFSSADASELTLHSLVEEFLRFLASRPSAISRQEYLHALLKVQTGTHAGREVDEAFADDVTATSGRVRLVPNVRRVFGDTRDETRQRIMLTFNTPFYPEILIASSVMAEGVDLHLNCRHVIHHDLEWNPSSLEQRTGRVDRLGSKAEQCGHPIRVYIPYLEGCQDEKLFRVVTDRERWFGVVMGAEKSMERILNATAWERERMAEQPAIPAAMARALTMSLGTAVDDTKP